MGIPSAVACSASEEIEFVLALGRPTAAAEAFGHHVPEVVVDNVFLGEVESIRRVGGSGHDENHLRAGGDRARPGCVQRCLELLALVEDAGMGTVGYDLRRVGPAAGTNFGSRLHALDEEVAAADHCDCRSGSIDCWRGRVQWVDVVDFGVVRGRQSVQSG